MLTRVTTSWLQIPTVQDPKNHCCFRKCWPSSFILFLKIKPASNKKLSILKEYLCMDFLCNSVNKWMWVHTQQKLSECLSIDASVEYQCFKYCFIFKSVDFLGSWSLPLCIYFLLFFIRRVSYVLILKGWKKGRAFFCWLKKTDAIGLIP